MSERYWRKVIGGAWSTTWRVLGWSNEKIASAVATFIGTCVVGGVTAGFNLVNSAIGAAVGVTVVATGVFVWGLFLTPAQLYRAAQDENRRLKERLAAAHRRKRPRAE